MDNSCKNDTVCVNPNSKYHFKDFKEKKDWLGPYYNVNPLISTVVNKMDDILRQ